MHASSDALIVFWRHPRPRQRALAGRCVGARSDLPADPRKARRLARRILRWCQRQHWPERTIWTSPLARATIVGRLLRRRGWQHKVEPRLAEVDFGAWDGRLWAEIPVAEIDAWRRELQDARPGGGESITLLAARVRAFCEAHRNERILVVGHGGWVRVARALVAREALDAGNWAAATLGHGQQITLNPALIAPANHV